MKEKLQQYSALLLEWNKIHNLGGNLHQALVEEYIQDSIFPLQFIHPFSLCIDVGSGAGFPGMILAICRQESEFILVEPRKKRSAFLHYVAVELGLLNLKIEKCTIQDLKTTKKADLITSRALMPTRQLMMLTQDFLTDMGHFLFYKGENLKNEISWDVGRYHQNKQRIYFYERKR